MTQLFDKINTIGNSAKGEIVKVTVCTKSDCVQCNATYRALDKEEVDYSIVDLTENPSARDRAMGLGYLQAPVVVAGDQHWSGFRPDRIAALAAA